MRYTTLALLGIVASAAALALLAGFANNFTPNNDYYAVGTTSQTLEPINVTSNLTALTVSGAGAQGKQNIGNITVQKAGDVNSVTLKISLVNPGQLKAKFDYIQFVIKLNKDGKNYTKAILSPNKPQAVIVLDSNDFNNGKATLYVDAYYEAKEGLLFDSLPVEFNIQVLQTS